MPVIPINPNWLLLASSTSHRGLLKKLSTISAQVPLAEMQYYTNKLRSMTGSRGIFTMEIVHYEIVPTFIKNATVTALLKELATYETEE